jgi:hypothetical protein
MSVLDRHELPCPSCGVVSAQELFSSINAARSPQLRGEILAGRLHLLSCPACRCAFRADAPLVYVDSARGQHFLELPRALEPSWEASEGVVREHFARLHEEAHPGLAGLRERLVFGLDALGEKLVAFEAGVDDAALEVLKMEVLRSSPGVAFHPDARPRLVAADEGELTLALCDEEGALRELRVPRAALSAVADSPAHAALIEEQRRGLYVDAGRWLIDGDAPWPEDDGVPGAEVWRVVGEKLAGGDGEVIEPPRGER